MGKGYMGKVLWVDLSSGNMQEQTVPDEVYERYLAGYGLGARLLWDRIPAGADPLGPHNVLGFVAGLLCGTGAHFAGRWQIVAKSPLTGGWGDANCGGDFGPAIKRAGVDGIFFTGQSERPVYLLIDGTARKLLDATDLWGKDAIETERELQQRHSNSGRVACIGPAGEKLSLISGVVNAHGRLAARSGVGAVMGSKKLKAVVLKGKAKIEPHDRQKIQALSKAFRERLDQDKRVDRLVSGKVLGIVGRVLKYFKTQPAMAGELFKFTLRIWGTSGIAAMSAETGDSPVKNWKGAGFKDFPLATRSSRVGDDAVTKYEVKKFACYSCPLACGGICSVKEGAYPLEKTHKPEYETLSAFGSLILVDDIHIIYQINEELNRAGMDTISAGTTVAWAFEAFERGLLTTNDTDGLRLVWGDGEAALALVRKMIASEGIGAVLKDGVKRAAERLGKGSEAFAVHAGGQELAMHDPRFDAGYGLAYEVEPTPGRHTIHSYTYTDLMALHKKTRRMPRQALMHTLKDRLGVKGKGETQAIASRYMEVANGCGLCLFGLSIGGNPPLVEWINAATGWNLSFEEYLTVGHRIKTLRHAFNLREGIRPEDTTMTPRPRGIPPLQAGPLKGLTPPFDELRRDFYRAMGWDAMTARPLGATLARLGLHDVKAALEG